MISNTQQTTTYYTHGFHPYPAKFTPQMVNKYLNLHCKKGFSILDPFCGSGTTLVEGVLNGLNSVGIDLNPIAYIVSKAKSSYYSNNDIQIVQDFIINLQSKINYGLFSDITSFEDIVLPDFPNIDHWFQQNVSYELTTLKELIEQVQNENVRTLLYCAFSKIIVKVSNQDSEVRYTARKKNHPNGIVYQSFIETLSYYLKILSSSEHSIIAKSEVYNGDSYNILKTFSENRFDLIITSPPYINTFDYYLYHKQRMFWLGFDHRPVRTKEIGNHHRIDTKSFESAKKEYVESMTQILNELSRVSKPKSYLVMIIGDGIVDGVTIDMSQVISQISSQTNYSVVKTESSQLSDITRSFNKKFSNAKKMEHTITLRNNKLCFLPKI